MTSTAARALYRLTVATLRWTWRVLLALFALTIAMAAGLGITAAVRHRRAARTALPAARPMVLIDSPTVMIPAVRALPAVDAPTVQLPAVRVGRHAA